uniref:Uncharacterized protein n=1 Tax=Anguilla anguilla TaxID=7936 RepID=A0A0E9VM46_ANGAN
MYVAMKHLLFCSISVSSVLTEKQHYLMKRNKTLVMHIKMFQTDTINEDVYMFIADLGMCGKNL